MADQHVVITGGAGFIGSHLCERFLTEGYRVTAIDNFLTGARHNVEHLLSNPAFRLAPGDVTQPISIGQRVDLALHFASPASPPDYLAHPIHTMKVDSVGSLHMLGLARAQGARYLLASTSEIYGDPLQHPQREDYWGNVNPVGPRSVYDEAKRFAEAATMAYHRAHGIDVRIARIFNTYGPRMRRNDGRAIPAFIDAGLNGRPLEVFGDGLQTRSFCYVEDLVEGIFRLAVYPGLDGEIVNLGSEEECQLLRVAELIKQMTGGGAPVVFRPLPQDDPRRRRPDLAKARRLLGYRPRVSLDEGLGRTIAWFSGVDRAASAEGPRVTNPVKI